MNGNISLENLDAVFATPLGAQSKYDWYNNNTWPASWLPSRKEKKKKK